MTCRGLGIIESQIAVGINIYLVVVRSIKRKIKRQILRREIFVTQAKICALIRIELNRCHRSGVATALLGRKNYGLTIEVERFAGLKNCRIGLNYGNIIDVAIGVRAVAGLYKCDRQDCEKTQPAGGKAPARHRAVCRIYHGGLPW